MSATTGFNLSGLTEMINETEFGDKFYFDALMQNDTFAFARQYGEVLTGAKMDTYKLPRFDVTATLQDGSGCGQNSVDQTTFAQTTLTMVPIKIEGQFCASELEPYFLAAGLPAGQNYTQFNPLEANIIMRLKEQIAKKMGIFPYYGPTGSDTVTYANPWVELLQAAFGINAGTATPNNGGTSGTDTNGVYNIVETLAGLFYANPDTAADANNGNIVVSMSPYDAWLYWQNYRTRWGLQNITPALQQLATGSYQTWTHPGTNISIATQNALGTGREIIASRKQNQVLAFDLESDATKILLWYDINDDLIKWRLRVKVGTAWRALNAQNINYWGTAS